MQVEVWLGRIEAGEQLTATDVTVGVAGGVLPPPFPPPPQPAMTVKIPAVVIRNAERNSKRDFKRYRSIAAIVDHSTRTSTQRHPQ